VQSEKGFDPMTSKLSQPKLSQSTVAGLATASQQMMLDALMAEMGALKAILPGHGTHEEDGGASDAARRAREADHDAMFDNMPV
jgi:hypothetical protein